MSSAAQACASSSTQRCTLRLDSGVEIEGRSLKVAVEFCLPKQVREPATILVCIPGGGMSRRFFDLTPADGGDGFSFALQMTARGHLVLLVDTLGVGESDRPEDVYALTPDLLVRANEQVVSAVLGGLREGTLIAQLSALPKLSSIGVGHSMGALLTVLQQAKFGTHAALAVLGFSTAGLPKFLIPEARSAMPEALSQGDLVRLARAQFGAEPSAMKRGEAPGDLFAGAKADPRGMAALKSALAPMLPAPAMLSMIPGNIAEACASIEVPIFIGVGELDLTGPAHAIPAAFLRSHDLTLQVLAQAGHSHFLFAARAQLFERLGRWAADAAQARPSRDASHFQQ